VNLNVDPETGETRWYRMGAQDGFCAIDVERLQRAMDTVRKSREPYTADHGNGPQTTWRKTPFDAAHIVAAYEAEDP
jgi:hypothetical protein